MFVELIEFLRCPRSHEPSALVTSATRVVDRHIVDGILGCPECGAEFPIASGVAIFDAAAKRAPATTPSDDEASRLAAFLELTDRRSVAVLCGAWGAHVERLLRVTNTPVLLVNPPLGTPVDVAAGIIVACDRLPLAAGVSRAAALDAEMSPGLIDSTVHAVRVGGRVVGPAALSIPSLVTEIARDEHTWVGERNADSPTFFVPLARGTS